MRTRSGELIPFLRYSQASQFTGGSRARPEMPPRQTLRPERNKPPVPQHEPNAAKALKQRDATDATQIGIVAKRLRQPVVGYAAAQMVYVVSADVRGEPPQNSGQVVIRTSAKRRVVKIPSPAMRPER